MTVNVTGIKSEIMINIDVSEACEKDYIWNPAVFNFENGKYLAGSIEDSAITCDEIK